MEQVHFSFQISKVMKKDHHFIAIVFCLILFASCDVAKYPICEKPDLKIDTRLIGVWREKGDTKSAFTYAVTKKTDFEYLLTCGDGSGKIEQYPAYLCKVKNALFLNIKDMENDTLKGYDGLRLRVIDPAGKKILASSIADTNLMSLNSSAEVLDYLSTNLDKPSLYKDTTWLFKIK